ncbi:MAG: hypothetical protein KAI40_03320 [Desulfobacterales bacterium]|nr:hypothetical protein [Desulfobacterales bacterium]
MVKDKNKNETTGHAPLFKNLQAVLEHLKKAGFKISQPKLYKNSKTGQIRVNPDGTVWESEVRGYASTLKRVGGKIDDLNDIHSRRSAKDILLIDEKILKIKFENEKEQGKYILRKDFEAELAARAVVFESGFRHLFNMKAREWIALVNGRVEKSPDLLQHLNAALDEQLNYYATTRVYQVMFEGDT